MKDDAERMAMSGSNEAHAVAHRHPVEAAHPTHRALMHWKNNRVAAPERNNFGPRLPPRALFGQHEFTAFELIARFGQQDRDLERKQDFSVAILVQAIEVVHSVFEHKWRRLDLPGIVANLEKIAVQGGIPVSDPYRLIPAICDFGKRRIQAGAERCDDPGQWIGKIFIFAPAKTMPAHDDAASEKIVPHIITLQSGAYVVSQQTLHDDAAICVERCTCRRPFAGIYLPELHGRIMRSDRRLYIP